MTPRWPSTLWVVRHGQSAGNVARDAAEAERIELDHRDVDVPLSKLGMEQSRALGEWFAAGEEDGRPEIMLASPYIRAVQTAEIFRKAGGCEPDEKICVDERLREKEFGILASSLIVKPVPTLVGDYRVEVASGQRYPVIGDASFTSRIGANV